MESKNDAGEGEMPGMYGKQPGRWLNLAVLIPAAVIEVSFIVALVVVLIALAHSAFEPGADPRPWVAATAVCAGLVTFFGWVSRGLLSAVQGKPVKHLFPPVVGIVLSGLLGLGSLAVLVSLVVSPGRASAGSARAGVGVVFLVYAVRETKKLWREFWKKRAPADIEL